jgi:dTDP-4-amino-4,6-dideoxygalactose transaminase
MRIGRTLPPAAAPLRIGDFLYGLCGILAGQGALRRFESQLREHFGAKHCFLVSSGKAAFTLILLALRELHPDRDEVLIPAFTCYSVPSSIMRAGLRVRLCDLRPDCLDLDPAQLSAALSPAAASRVLAVVPTHLFGFVADVAGACRLAPGAVAVVEDSAQAMGESSGAGKAGARSDAVFLSLGRGKALSLVEGGVILTDRDDLARELDGLVGRLPRYGLLRTLGTIVKAAAIVLLMRPGLFWLPRGLPFLKLGETLYEPHFPMLRMSSFQAGLARNWRARLEASRQARSSHVQRWIASLDAAGLRSSEFLRGQRPALLRFPFGISNQTRRDRLLRESIRRGLGVAPAYPTSIDAIPELRGSFGGGAYPVAASCARELVTLPTHEYLTQADVARLGELVARVMRTDVPEPAREGGAMVEQR